MSSSSSSSDDEIDLSEVLWNPSNIKSFKEVQSKQIVKNIDEDETVYRKGSKLLDKMLSEMIEIKDNVWKEDSIKHSESPTGVYLFTCSSDYLTIESESNLQTQIKDDDNNKSNTIKPKYNESSSESDSSEDDELKFSETAVEFNFATKQFGLVKKVESPPKKMKKKKKKKK